MTPCGWPKHSLICGSRGCKRKYVRRGGWNSIQNGHEENISGKFDCPWRLAECLRQRSLTICYISQKTTHPLTSLDLLTLAKPVKRFRGVFMRVGFASLSPRTMKSRFVNPNVSKRHVNAWIAYTVTPKHVLYFYSCGIASPLEVVDYLPGDHFYLPDDANPSRIKTTRKCLDDWVV